MEPPLLTAEMPKRPCNCFCILNLAILWDWYCIKWLRFNCIIWQFYQQIILLSIFWTFELNLLEQVGMEGVPFLSSLFIEIWDFGLIIAKSNQRLIELKIWQQYLSHPNNFHLEHRVVASLNKLWIMFYWITNKQSIEAHISLHSNWTGHHLVIINYLLEW